MMNTERSSTRDLSQGQLNLTNNGSSFEYGMLLTPKDIVMSTPNSRSSPLFKNFQTDGQQSVSPIGSPCSPTKPNFKPVTKNRALGFSDSEAAQNNGFDIFGIGFSSEEHAGSERTFSSSSNSSHNSLLSEESFTHILRSIQEQGEVSNLSSIPIPIDVSEAGNSPSAPILQSGMQDEVNPYLRITRQDQALAGLNGITSNMLNTSFHDSDDTFRSLNSSKINPAFFDSSPIQQNDYCSLLECLNLNGELSSLSSGIKPQAENERPLWDPPVPPVPSTPPCIEAINAKLPTVFPKNHKDLIKLLVVLNDLQESIYSYEPYQRDLINDHVNNIKQRVLKELSVSTPSPSSTYNKNSNLNRFTDSFEAMKYTERIQQSPRYQRESFDSFEYSPRNQIAWQGNLPQRNHRNAVYSCKVFVGGVPWDITEQNLFHAFRQYNPVKVEWPIKDGHPSQSKGYAYVVFESEKQVKLLLQNCDYKFNNGGCWYHKVSSKKMKSKEAQIIPWAQWDTNFDRSPTPKLDPQQTIFVGALHGMINAEALALIMHELFQGVIYAGIDTDRYRYPIGSGRVAFNNTNSYMKAVAAQFVEIRTKKFCKKVQVDPYLEDATCSVCQLQQGPYFCRDLKCFRYFCKTCFQYHHSSDSLRSHPPLMRNSAKPLGTPGSYQPVCYNQQQQQPQQQKQSDGGAYRNYSPRQITWPTPYNNGQPASTNGRNNFHFNGYNNGFESQIHNHPGYMSQSPSQYMR